ncbi:MAG: peptide deformylase [Deltaproteobacteria bacterium]
MVREILIWPDPRLKEKAKPVSKVDAEIQKLVDDLFETMYSAEGVGLAATQIGVLHRVVVVDVSPRQEDQKPLALINPVILSAQGNTSWTEGCLSVPGESEEVERAEVVTVQALDRDGKRIEIADATGLLAIALQHETDHLDGTLFVDHLSALKREVIRRRMKRLKQDIAEGREPRDDSEDQPAL